MKNKRYWIVRIIASTIMIAGSVMFFMPGCGDSYSKQLQGQEFAILTHAPLVPLPINRNYPTKVIVNLETKEVTRSLADGVEYNFWTFGGDVPGKFIRIRVGDLVEFHLSNDPTSKMSVPSQNLIPIKNSEIPQKSKDIFTYLYPVNVIIRQVKCSNPFSYSSGSRLRVIFS